MEADKSEQEMITVAGGVELEVAYRNNGSKEVVKVRQIPVSKTKELLLAQGDDAKSIELYCDKPDGWADTLTLESASDICEVGLKIHEDFWRRWWTRQATMRNMQAAWTGESVPKSPTVESRSASFAPQSPITTT